MIRLERVTDSLPAQLPLLRSAARAEGFGMLDVLGNEWTADQTRFDRAGEALIAGFWDEALAGIGGMTIDPFRPGVLRMRRFYVLPAHRRHGIARAIATALLDRPEVAASVVTTNAARGSEAFWESLGFAAQRRERQTHVLMR
jgi:GNAT superfamily N-acetyltransferase